MHSRFLQGIQKIYIFLTWFTLSDFHCCIETYCVVQCLHDFSIHKINNASVDGGIISSFEKVNCCFLYVTRFPINHRILVRMHYHIFKLTCRELKQFETN